MNEVTSLSDDAALQAIGEQASKVNNMACQTVAEAARLGQMIADYRGEKPSLESLSRVITITGYGQAHIFRLIKLAKNWDAISDKKPESLRQALRMLEPPAPKPEPAPAPAPQPAPQPAPKPEAAPVRMTDEQANAAIEAVKVEANMSKSAGERFDAAVKKAVKIALDQIRENYHETLAKMREEIERDAAGPLLERLKAKEEAAEVQKEMWETKNTAATTFLSQDEFKLIRGCLHSDRVPDELRERFDRAFVAFNKLSPWFEAEAETGARRARMLAELNARWAYAQQCREHEAARKKAEQEAKRAARKTANEVKP